MNKIYLPATGPTKEELKSKYIQFQLYLSLAQAQASLVPPREVAPVREQVVVLVASDELEPLELAGNEAAPVWEEAEHVEGLVDSDCKAPEELEAALVAPSQIPPVDKEAPFAAEYHPAVGQPHQRLEVAENQRHNEWGHLEQQAKTP